MGNIPFTSRELAAPSVRSAPTPMRQGLVYLARHLVWIAQDRTMVSVYLAYRRVPTKIFFSKISTVKLPAKVDLSPMLVSLVSLVREAV